MGIGGITSSTNNMSFMKMTSTNVKDHKSKNIQKEITDVQQQIQKLSSENELSADEKANERKKLQKEKSSLDTKLKQHQEELLRSQKREIRLAELQEDQAPSKEDEDTDKVQAAGTSSITTDKEKQTDKNKQSAQPGTIITQNSDGTVILKGAVEQSANAESATESRQTDEAKAKAAEEKEAEAKEEDAATDTDLPGRQMEAMVSADTSMRQAERMGSLVTKTEDGIAVLKGEIKQDAYRGVDTERKETELNDMQKQRKREMGVQFALLGEAGYTMKSANDTESLKDRTQGNAGKNFQVSGLNVSPEEQAIQQGLQVSIA